MKKILAAICCVILLSASSQAQFRKLRPDEISYMNKAYTDIWNAIPHEYKDWKPNGDPKAFDAANRWCGVEGVVKCYGTCPVSLGKSEQYNINVFQDFAMGNDESGALMGAALRGITDYQNGAQIATALKATAKSKLQIHVYSNEIGGEFTMRYCDKVPVVKIDLPVTATLAYKAIRSVACPMYNSGTKTVDMKGDYYDNALIFLGQPVSKKREDDRSDGISRTVYSIGFDKTKISKPLMQNIVVQIIGDSDDIDAAVKAIDWKALYALIGK